MTLVVILLGLAFGVVGAFSAFEAGKSIGRDHGYRACLGERDDD